MFDDIDKQFKPTPVLACTRCGTTVGVTMHPSYTAYTYDGPIHGPDDPNKPLPFCDPCGEEHRLYWEECWAEYYGGLL